MSTKRKREPRLWVDRNMSARGSISWSKPVRAVKPKRKRAAERKAESSAVAPLRVKMSDRRWVTLGPEFRVKVFGRFAAHCGIGFDYQPTGNWSATHISSGLGKVSLTRTQAIKLAKRWDALDCDLDFKTVPCAAYKLALPKLQAVYRQVVQ